MRAASRSTIDRQTAGRVRPRSWWIVVLLAAVCAGPWAGVEPARADAGREALLKAAFLYRFVDFVHWPDSVATAPDSTFGIGVLGPDPFGEALDEVFRSPEDIDHDFVVRRSDEAEELLDCRIVYVAQEDPEAIAASLDLLGERPVLVVGHGAGFAEHGGHVNFFVEDERLRFEVNLDAVHAAGLRMSSRLLALARIVDPRGR